MLARMDRQRPGHPEVVQRVLHRSPRPPPPASRRPPSLEIAIAHRPVGPDGLAHRLQHLAVSPEPPRPAGVAALVVEHRAPPPRKIRRRHEAGRVRPVLEQPPALIDLAIEPRPVVRPESAPDRQVVRALQDVDRVELNPADVLDEAAQARRRQRGRARPGEMLALQEERGDGAQRNRRAGHAAQLIIPVMASPNGHVTSLRRSRVPRSLGGT